MNSDVTPKGIEEIAAEVKRGIIRDTLGIPLHPRKKRLSEIIAEARRQRQENLMRKQIMDDFGIKETEPAASGREDA